jgi:hypothetical protein
LKALFADLQPDETEILGAWIVEDNQARRDHNTRRIQWLIENRLTEIARAGGGWDTLYQDPHDHRYWERVYLQSATHGGGPPSLLCLGPEAAKVKYDLR